MSGLPPPPGWPPPKSPTLGELIASLTSTSNRSNRYVHLTVFPKGISTFPTEVYEAVKKSIDNMSTDWLKYSAYCWIMYTDKTPEEIYQKLLADVPALKPHSILTFYFDISSPRSGQQIEMVWDWLKKQR
jgi:hypothetical protein